MKYWNEKEIAHTIALLEKNAPELDYEFALYMKNDKGFSDGYLYKEGENFIIKDGSSLSGDFCRVDAAKSLPTLFVGTIENLLDENWVVD